MKILLLATGYPSQYRVLRCAAGAGADVYVIGNLEATDLAKSRFCQRFIPAECGMTLENSTLMADQVNRYIRELDIDCVLPADATTTRILAEIRGYIHAPVFPIPDLEVFDLLNDKARFAELCTELDVPCPKGRVIASKEALRNEIHEIALPSIAKPLALFGGEGVIKLDAPSSVATLDYEPILVQEFVDGQDISIALYCHRGTVVAELAYFLQDGVFHFVSNDSLSENARKVVSHYAYDGVICFDARIEPSGGVKFLECNPRFWYNMDVAMSAGINFVQLGLDAITGRDSVLTMNTTVRTRKSLVRALITPWRLNRGDLATARYILADPGPLAMAALQRA